MSSFWSIQLNLVTLAYDLFHELQAILKTGSFDRDELEEIGSEVSRKMRLWRSIQAFEEHLDTWENTPFQQLDVKAMETEITRYVL